jgi:hypothetical protein
MLFHRVGVVHEDVPSNAFWGGSLGASEKRNSHQAQIERAEWFKRVWFDLFALIYSEN